MTDKEAMAMALEVLENIIDAVYVNSEMEAIAVKRANIVIAALKERLAQEKALQALHNENERLGLYKDAYAEQEPVAWMWDVNNGGGYTSKGIGFMQTNIPFAKHTPLYAHPPQRTEGKK